MSPQNDFLECALEYARRGFSIIPIRPDKKPYVKWTDFQKRRATEEELAAWWGKWPQAMIGIVTGAISNLFVVDCDTLDGYQKVQAHLPDSFLTPIAETPRDGKHVYFLSVPGFTVAAGVMGGVDIRGEGGYVVAPPSVNGTGRAYSWADGLSLDDVAPAPMPNALISALKDILINSMYRGGSKEESHNSHENHESHKNHKNLFTEGRRDEDLFHHAYVLLKGGMDKAGVTETIDFLARNSIPPYPIPEARRKVESAFQRFLQRNNDGRRNIAGEIEEWVKVTTGHFKVTDWSQEVTKVTKQEMHAATMALLRLKERGIIEKVGSMHGVYRRIEHDAELVNFLDAPTSEFPLALPLGVSDYCQIFPGNIIVIAGGKSAGKTAYLLNTVKDNMRRHEIIYLNSEMGDTEFRKRLELFGAPLTDWKFRPVHRMTNFADLITPEKKIFIIDFLEVTTDFWKVAQYIQEIHKKLKEGIAIIALQKSDNKDMGRGGDFSKEKARLYIALDYLPAERMNQIKIVDAKAWRTDVNPRGMHRCYKLVQGAKFLPVDGWSDEPIKRK